MREPDVRLVGRHARTAYNALRDAAIAQRRATIEVSYSAIARMTGQSPRQAVKSMRDLLESGMVLRAERSHHNATGRWVVNTPYRQRRARFELAATLLSVDVVQIAAVVFALELHGEDQNPWTANDFIRNGLSEEMYAALHTSGILHDGRLA